MVIIIAHAFWGEGAVSARARAETRLLLGMGYKVTVLTTTLRGESQFRNDTVNRADIITLTPWSLHRRIRKPARELTFAYKCIHHIKNNIEPRSIEFIVYHPAMISIFMEPFCRMKNITSVFVAHSLMREMIRHRVNSQDYLTTLIYCFAEKKAIQNATFVIAISGYMRQQILRIRKKDDGIVDLPNAVNPTDFAPPANCNRPIDILYAGRLAREKGIDVLLDAIALLSIKPTVYIAGEGPEKAALQNQVKKKKLQNIVFTGHIPHCRIHNWFWRAKLIVVPSWCEPQGIILLESMSSGAVVIGANAGAIPEFIQHHQNGLLFPAGNREALAKAIHLILSNPAEQKRISHKSRSIVKKWNEFTFEEKFKGLLTTIETVKIQA
jgi:glycosyltransferase involved in cell wall biosynthesis